MIKKNKIKFGSAIALIYQRFEEKEHSCIIYLNQAELEEIMLLRRRFHLGFDPL